MAISGVSFALCRSKYIRSGDGDVHRVELHRVVERHHDARVTRSAFHVRMSSDVRHALRVGFVLLGHFAL